jgi:hypothetical protein
MKGITIFYLCPCPFSILDVTLVFAYLSSAIRGDSNLYSPQITTSIQELQLHQTPYNCMYHFMKLFYVTSTLVMNKKKAQTKIKVPDPHNGTFFSSCSFGDNFENESTLGVSSR